MNLTWAAGRTAIKVVNWTKFVILLTSSLTVRLAVRARTTRPTWLSEVMCVAGLSLDDVTCAFAPSPIYDDVSTTIPAIWVR